MLHFNKPKIGVTGPDRGGKASWLFTAVSILLKGGIPVHITPSRPKDLRKLHGLIIGGGADVDPLTYEDQNFIEQYIKEPPESKRLPMWKRVIRFFRRLLYSIIFLLRRMLSRRRKAEAFGLDKERDRLEFYLVDEAVKANMPILGVCRGMQLINVYFKGTLYKEIKPFYVEEVNRSSIFPIKKVFIERGSKLFSIIQCHAIKVNALHHQAVNEPGKGINIVALERNGLVQAIESTQHDFIIGVQWHPEYLIERKRQRWLFRALVRQAKAWKDKAGHQAAS